jgi:hypothetical protein
MTITEVLRELFACPSVQRYGGESGLGSVHSLTEALVLPRAHEILLAESNGLMAYGGYFRLFGVTAGPARASCIDMVDWNAPGTWRFAWPEHVSTYLCFGETAWGDQYAYRIDDVRAGSTPAVYFLEATGMRPERLSDSFGSFLSDEFLRNCRDPYDALIVDARKRFGDLPAHEHLVYAPSPLITGEESLEHAIKMDARTAMIANGDLASQLGGELQSRQISRLESYTDAHSRPRLRVVWADGR